MSRLSCLLPKRQRPSWDPVLESIPIHEDALIELPLLGYVTAGRPIETPEDQRTISVPRTLVRPARRKATYALRVRGYSMIDDQIQDGDIIIVEQRASAENGESVVAMINGERVTLKRFYVEADGIRLQPANPEMAPIYLRHEELQILGIVTGVIRHG
jgi:repressor LexA